MGRFRGGPGGGDQGFPWVWRSSLGISDLLAHWGLGKRTGAGIWEIFENKRSPEPWGAPLCWTQEEEEDKGKLLNLGAQMRPMRILVLRLKCTLPPPPRSTLSSSGPLVSGVVSTSPWSLACVFSPGLCNRLREVHRP